MSPADKPARIQRERRESMKPFSVFVMVVAMTFATVPPAFADEGPAKVAPAEPGTGQMALDLIVIRPVAVAGAIMSTALCIGLTPFWWLTGTGSPATRVMIEAPWRYATARKLGVFHNASQDGEGQEAYVDGKPVTGPVDANEK
jgi:hypothetical protein